ncbi:MAG: glycosyltransferase [Alphaproteobacteria bacterium]|nr:glycosyltransferase [Alphaproteobacteria bacterium]
MSVSENAKRIAVIIPCYNEEATIAKVVKDFKKALPEAVVYVYDNNSTDNSFANAQEAGAVVRKEHRQGKGYVVCRMFADIDADIYVMVDADCTYDVSAAPAMVAKLVEENLDLVTGVRISEEKEAYRFGHRFGNWMFKKIVSVIFKCKVTDMLSGYRVFSRRYVKTFPWLCEGFDVESKLTIHAIGMDIPMADVETRYFSRPEDSASKLNTYRDGIRILSAIILMMKEERSLLFFSLIAAFFLSLAFILGVPIIMEYCETGAVRRIPTAILIVGILTCSLLSFVCGLILDTVSRGHKEKRRLAYLEYKSPQDS